MKGVEKEFQLELYKAEESVLKDRQSAATWSLSCIS